MQMDAKKIRDACIHRLYYGKEPDPIPVEEPKEPLLQNLLETDIFEKLIVPFLMLHVPYETTTDNEVLKKSGWFSEGKSSHYGALPGLDVLKLAHLNKAFASKITEIFPPFAL